MIASIVTLSSSAAVLELGAFVESLVHHSRTQCVSYDKPAIARHRSFALSVATVRVMKPTGERFKVSGYCLVFPGCRCVVGPVFEQFVDCVDHRMSMVGDIAGWTSRQSALFVGDAQPLRAPDRLDEVATRLDAGRMQALEEGDRDVA